MPLGATPLAAQPAPTFDCFGNAPAWRAEVRGDGAQLDYIGSHQMSVPQSSRAEGRAWPMAMTLISGDYSTTAILIVDERACETGGADFDYAAEMLTQRADTPVLLAGCCILQD